MMMMMMMMTTRDTSTSSNGSIIMKGEVLVDSTELPYISVPVLSHHGTAHRYCSSCRHCFDADDDDDDADHDTSHDTSHVNSTSSSRRYRCKCGMVYCNEQCFDNDDHHHHHRMVCKASDSLISGFIKFSQRVNDVYRLGLLVLQHIAIASIGSSVDAEMVQFEKDFSVVDDDDDDDDD